MRIPSFIWTIWAEAFQPKPFRPVSGILFSSSTPPTPSDLLSTSVCPFLESPTALPRAQATTLPSSPIPLDAPTTSPPSASGPIADPCPVCALLADATCSCCTQNFCQRHLFRCPDCQLSFCGSCFDLHTVEGHWSDSHSAAALAAGSRSLAADHRNSSAHKRISSPPGSTAHARATRNPSPTQPQNKPNFFGAFDDELPGLITVAAVSQTARKIPAIAISNLLRLQSTSRRTRISLTAIRRLLFRNSELTLSSPPAANQLLLPRTLRRVCASLAIAINRLLLRLTLPRLGHPFPISPATAEAGQ